jgi:kynurenine aminotransferase
MWDRTVTIGSAGSECSRPAARARTLKLTAPLRLESFGATGWRVGWLIGPEQIITPTLAASTRIVFCSNSPLQEAVAGGLEQAQGHNYFEVQRQEYAERRDVLVEAFKQLNVPYVHPEGSYFILMVRGSGCRAPSFS